MKTFKQFSEEIAGVQPMTEVGKIFTIRHASVPRYQVIDPVIDGLKNPPKGYITIEVDMEIGRWIEQQPLYMWKHGEYFNPNTIGFDAHFGLYNDIVDWIHANIKRPYSNAHWVKIGDGIYVHIRKKRDWMWFTMRWGV